MTERQRLTPPRAPGAARLFPRRRPLEDSYAYDDRGNIRSKNDDGQGGPGWVAISEEVLLSTPFALVNWYRNTAPCAHAARSVSE
jgi:hypothetical protein